MMGTIKANGISWAGEAEVTLSTDAHPYLVGRFVGKWTGCRVALLSHTRYVDEDMECSLKDRRGLRITRLERQVCPAVGWDGLPVKSGTWVKDQGRGGIRRD